MSLGVRNKVRIYAVTDMRVDIILKSLQQGETNGGYRDWQERSKIFYLRVALLFTLKILTNL